MKHIPSPVQYTKDFEISGVNSNADRISFWKGKYEGQEEYGFTIWVDSPVKDVVEEGTCQLDFDIISRKQFIEFVRQCAYLIKEEFDEEI